MFICVYNHYRFCKIDVMNGINQNEYIINLLCTQNIFLMFCKIDVMNGINQNEYIIN